MNFATCSIFLNPCAQSEWSPSEPEIPFKLDVCEIYVVFDDSADRLISVAFSNVSTTAQQGFFQHTLGGNTGRGAA